METASANLTAHKNYVGEFAKCSETPPWLTHWGETNLTNPTMHLFHIQQYTIQNRNVHIFILNNVLWQMDQVHCGIYELGQFLEP